MQSTQQTLAAIHTLPSQGKNRVGDRWHDFVPALRRILRRCAVMQQGSNEILLLFSFQHPFSAISLTLDALTEARLEIGWPDSAGPLPVQIVFHLDSGNDPEPQLADCRAALWNFLSHDTPYVSRTLKNHWQEVMTGRTLPPHRFEQADNGLFSLIFSADEKIRTERIFPHRALPLRGTSPSCYYCSMRNHAPRQCPSKLLPHDSYALPLAGRLPPEKLASVFGSIMAKPTECRHLLEAGFEQATLRQNHALLVLHSYLDIFLIFQPRFLFTMTFTAQIKWYSAEKFGAGKIDNRPMQMALDCLRVGNLPQAEELFMKEVSRFEGKQFAAAIGLAFVALEKGRMEDMASWLDRARTLATNEKEHIYSALLAGRLHFLRKAYYEAKEVISQGRRIKGDCSELLYLLVEVESGQEQIDPGTVQQLTKLVAEDPYLSISALLDPHLLAIEGFVEEIHASLLTTAKNRIQNLLAKAEAEREETAQWLDCGNEELQRLAGDLVRLQEIHDKTGYFGLLEVEARIKALAHAFAGMRERLVEKLAEDVEHEKHRADTLTLFWKNFPCRILFTVFKNKLQNVKKGLQQAAIRDNDSLTPEQYRQFLKTHEQSRHDLSTLEERLKTMNWICTLAHGLRVFFKKLVMAELIMVPVFICLTYGLHLLPDLLPFLSSQMAIDTLTSQITRLTVLVLAPAVAILKTWTELRDQ